MGAIPRMIINLFVLTNIVDASKAVSKALGVPKKYRGDLDITWSDGNRFYSVLFAIKLFSMFICYVL